jgi:outer membrane cobalamin receptor
VASGGLSGTANPSISGGSGLENLYVADGVNITDSAFGGLGVFSRVYGSLATGINLSFIKEVQVKTGGYEPQYGKATGGIVQIVTKSGGTEYHGAIAGYFAPQQFEAERLHPDDFRFNKTGKTLHVSNFDVSAEMGGYVPGFRDKLFFFASVNPSYGNEFGQFERFPNVPNPPNVTIKTNTLNYAGKLTYKLSDKHTFVHRSNFHFQ